MPYVLLDDDTKQVAGKFVLLDDATPVAVKTGSALNDIPRQVGLTARYALEGAGQAVQPITEPLRQLIVNPLARAGCAHRHQDERRHGLRRG